MAIMTKTLEIVIVNASGVPVPGKTVIFYPAGTSSNGTTANDNGDGSYTVVLDPASPDGNIIDRRYDVWWDAAKQIDDFEAGWWEFSIDKSITTDPETITYGDEADLPSPIPNAKCIALIPHGDRLFYIDSIDDTTLTIVPSTAGDDLPITVTLVLRGG